MLSYAFVLLHLSILLAGFTGVLGRLITLNEGLLVWYRVMFASVFFLMYLVVKKGQIKLTVKDALRIAWVGLLLSIHWLLFYGSIKYSNVSIGVVCFASVGFFTAILDPVLSKRAFSIRRTDTLRESPLRQESNHALRSGKHCPPRGIRHGSNHPARVPGIV